MNRLFVAKKLLAFVDDEITEKGKLIESKNEIASEVWDKMIQYMKNGSDCAAIARASTGRDSYGLKALQKARAMYSVIKKIKELKGIDLTDRFIFKPKKVTIVDPATGEKKEEERTDTFESVACQNGATAAECTQYIEPPDVPLHGQPGFLTRLLEYVDKGTTTILYQRSKNVGVSNAKLDNFKNHSAYKTFESRFLNPLQRSQVSVNVSSNGNTENEIMYMTDKIKVFIPMFKVKFFIELSSAVNPSVEDQFSISSWEGPKTKTDIPLDEMIPLSGPEIESLATDISNADFQGSAFTPDVVTKDENGVETTSRGKNIMLLTDAELSQYFNSAECELNEDEKIDIMSKRKDAGRKDPVTADNMLAVLTIDPNSWNTTKVQKFMADFQNVFNWEIISKVMANLMPESIIAAFKDKVVWKFIASKRGLSDNFVKSFAAQLSPNSEKVLRNNPNLSQDAKDALEIGGAVSAPASAPAQEEVEEESEI